MENINDLTERQIKELAERLSEVNASVNRGTSNYSGAVSDFAQASSSAASTADRIADGFAGFGQGAIQFTKAMVDGKPEMTKYSAGIESVTSGIGDVVGAFGPIGMVFGALIKVVGKITSTVLEQNQIYLDAYDALAEFGGVSGRTADELKAAVLQLDYNQYTLPGLIKATTSLSTSIMSMGSTAGKGQEVFFNLSQVGREKIKEFSRLGISQEELTQHQADYIKQQSKTGLIQSKDMTGLKDKSLAYAQNLVKISALTGQTIDATKRGRDRDLEDYKYAATVREEQEAGRDDVVRNMENTLDRVRGTFGESWTTGIREILSTGLANQSAAAAGLNTLTGGAIFDWVKQRKAGTMTEEDFLKKMQGVLSDTVKTYGFVAKSNEDFTERTGLNADALRGLSKNIGDATAAGQAVTDRMTSQNDTLLEGRNAGNDATNAMQKAFEAFVQLVAGPINFVFTGLLNGLKALAQGFIKQLSRMGALPDEMEFMFMNYAELGETQTELTSQIEKQTKLVSEDSYMMRQVAPMGAGGKSIGDTVREELATAKRRLSALERVKASASPPPAPAMPAAAPASAAPASAAAAPAARQTETYRVGTRQGFAKGGITDGPMSGHLGYMHDLEAVVPLPDGKSIPVKLNIPQLAEKQKNPLLDTNNLASIIDSYTKALTKSTGSSTQATFVQEAATDFGFISTIAERMDTLISSMKTNTSLQSELLYYVKR